MVLVPVLVGQVEVGTEFAAVGTRMTVLYLVVGNDNQSLAEVRVELGLVVVVREEAAVVVVVAGAAPVVEGQGLDNGTPGSVVQAGANDMAPPLLSLLSAII